MKPTLTGPLAAARAAQAATDQPPVDLPAVIASIKARAAFVAKYPDVSNEYWSLPIWELLALAEAAEKGPQA
jgi:hypothetical protein